MTRLASHFLRAAERRGTDIRIDTGIPFRAKAWPRSGIQTHLFNWAIVHDYPWKHVAHINVLELQANMNSDKWRLRRSNNLEHRVILLLDSQVICMVITKGRSSSRLQRSLKVLNAPCLAGDLVLAIAYKDIYNNPSDIPSRWGGNILQNQGPN